MAKFLGVPVAALLLASAAQADEHGRWQRLENNPSCSVWIAHPQPNEVVTWSGACANGRAQGRGTQLWRYLEDGEWKESKYTGEMKTGKWHGRGVYLWASGSRYEGDWKAGMQHGRGVEVWAEGSRYEGDFVDGKYHGRGVLVYASGGGYEGDWKDGKWHGRGAITFANGDLCEGNWREGRLSGTGKGRKDGRLKNCYLDGNRVRFTE